VKRYPVAGAMHKPLRKQSVFCFLICKLELKLLVCFLIHKQNSPRITPETELSRHRVIRRLKSREIHDLTPDIRQMGQFGLIAGLLEAQNCIETDTGAQAVLDEDHFLTCR